MADLTRGANTPLSSTHLSLTVRGAAQGSVDLLVFQTGGDRTVRSDADLVFFNQPESPEGAVQLRGTSEVAVDLASVPTEITTLVVAVTLDDSVSGSLADIPGLAVTVVGEADSHLAVADGLTTERSAVLVEVYRHQAGWKLKNISAGWTGGLAALVTEHGVSVGEDPAGPAAPAGSAAPSVPPTPAGRAVDDVPVRSVPGEAKLSLQKRQVLDLRKKEVQKVLLSKDASGVSARVVLVIDKSGSMMEQYQQSTIHRVIERMIPVAIQLDTDGILEPYLYADRCLRLPDLTVEGSEDWLKRNIQMDGSVGIRQNKLDFAGLGYGNSEHVVMEAIIKTVDKNNRVPTLVLFFTDGGIYHGAKIQKLLKSSSKLPIFWQFVGTGGDSYGVLEEFDSMGGRAVDNAGFFSVDNTDQLSDGELYRLLLSEFPDWIRAAQAAGILVG